MGALDKIKDLMKLVQTVGNADLYKEPKAAKKDSTELSEKVRQLQDEKRELLEIAFIQKEAGIKLEGKYDRTIAERHPDSVYDRVMIWYKNPKSAADRIEPKPDSPGTKKAINRNLLRACGRGAGAGTIAATGSANGRSPRTRTESPRPRRGRPERGRTRFTDAGRSTS